MFCTLAMILFICMHFYPILVLEKVWLFLTSPFHKTNGALGYDAKTAIFCVGSVVPQMVMIVVMLLTTKNQKPRFTEFSLENLKIGYKLLDKICCHRQGKAARCDSL